MEVKSFYTYRLNKEGVWNHLNVHCILHHEILGFVVQQGNMSTLSVISKTKYYYKPSSQNMKNVQIVMHNMVKLSLFSQTK